MVRNRVFSRILDYQRKKPQKPGFFGFAGGARNRVFSRILDYQRKKPQKPGFFGFGWGQKPGFFEEEIPPNPP